MFEPSTEHLEFELINGREFLPAQGRRGTRHMAVGHRLTGVRSLVGQQLHSERLRDPPTSPYRSYRSHNFSFNLHTVYNVNAPHVL